LANASGIIRDSELRGQFYNTSTSKIGPKPIQNPHIPIYLGGFSLNTFARIVNYNITGWLGGIGGPLEQLENPIKTIKDNAKKANKDPNDFKILLLTFPNLADPKSQTTIEDSQRYPLTGTIDQIGGDIKRITS
jgi:alkanesulfonate monooxygenase SsuD/methylene tetrahydromethanopterin reductase-like flavin-dependent oxidoreductase (luciferase family)